MNKRLREQIEEPNEAVIVKLFKLLNEEKKKHKTRAALLDAIKNFAPYMNIPEEYSLYLLELYLLNYRKDGNYSGLKKSNFIDPRKEKGKTTKNAKARQYTIAQLPFKGSNLEGYWRTDRNGEPYYVVVSYRWYPVLLFKNDRWYEISNRYSSSTSKQIYNADPIGWNDDVYDKVTLVTKDEMEDLMNGRSHEYVMKKKLEKLKGREKELTSQRMSSVKTHSWYGMADGERVEDTNIKFKIKSIDIEDDTAIVTIDVYDVLRREDGKGVKTPENYLKGEISGITPKKVEERIERKVMYNLKDYIGGRYKSWADSKTPNHKIKLKFNHLRQ